MLRFKTWLERAGNWDRGDMPPELYERVARKYIGDSRTDEAFRWLIENGMNCPRIEAMAYLLGVGRLPDDVIPDHDVFFQLSRAGRLHREAGRPAWLHRGETFVFDGPVVHVEGRTEPADTVPDLLTDSRDIWDFACSLAILNGHFRRWGTWKDIKNSPKGFGGEGGGGGQRLAN